MMNQVPKLDRLQQIDAWWRAANYLSVAQYLLRVACLRSRGGNEDFNVP